MCGIAGVLSFRNSSFEVTEELIKRMRDTMTHRGPDGSGTWISTDGKVGLGHRRLAIIDLSSAASQPMTNEDGTLWISFNGEIYNHAEIRAELKSIGSHRWKTDHSDTEVILHSFEQWGIRCLEKFRGMFAIALWDIKKRELWLVRDRIGIKPLYYSAHHGRLTFASEIKALLEDPEQKKDLNEEAFYHYMSFWAAPAPMTFFSGIQKLPPATWLRVTENGQMHAERYWDVWDHAKPLRNDSENDIIEKIRYEFAASVKLRKVSDVPVGIFLSGGIDSSMNAELFARGESRPIQTFTIGYDQEYETYHNETYYARLMAKRVGAEAHERLLNVNDFVSFLPKMIELQDEPLGDPVCMPVYYVADMARKKGVIVCQVGEGADELFCGYASWPRAISMQQFSRWPIPLCIKESGLNGLRRMGKDHTTYYEWLRRSFLNQPVFWGGTDNILEVQKKCLLSDRLKKRFAGETSWSALEGIYERFEKNAWEKSPLNWMSYCDLSLRLPELMLMRVDKMCMGVSVEARVPFLDHKFVELSMSIPQSMKIRNGQTKYLFKKAVRNVIPDELIDRTKQGFQVPIAEWFLGRLGDFAKNEFDWFLKNTDILNRKELERLSKCGRKSQIWSLLNFVLWWKRFIK